jgi:glycerate 2-kinase
MLITNFRNLARNPLRRKALLIAEAGYEAIKIEKNVKEKIKISEQVLTINGRKINLSNFRRVFLVGIGKGSTLASAALAKILGKRLTAGIALDVQRPSIKHQVSSIKFLTGTHPLPSPRNIKATREIVKLAKSLKKDDLLITFICGGGSALACASKTELRASQIVFKELTKKGADIFEINTIRKHLSEIKGGGLAKLVYPATLISLIVSDVPGNNLSMVASGPTFFDRTTKKDAEKVLKKYSFNLKKFNLIETPKDKKYFKKAKNVFFVSNKDAVLTMAKKAKFLGFKPKICSSAIRGEADHALLPLIKRAKKGTAILAAGETTVSLDNRPVGKGGRNTEAVLGAISNFSRFARSGTDRQFPISKKLIVVAFATDGRDNTEAAGAIADFSTLEKAKKLKLNPKKFLDQNNSFNFFKKTGDLIFSQKKSFNVSDLMIVLRQ